MSIRNKGLVFAMEDAELDAVPTEVVPAAELEVEQGTAEVVESAGEIDDINTAIEEAVEDAGTLSDIQDTMSDSVEEGEGLSEDAAEIAEVAVEAICVRLGIRNKSSTIPALESFGSKNSRLAATRIAIENVGEKLKTVWEAIKKAFATVWQKIKDFFARFFSNTEKVKKYAKELKDQAVAKKNFKSKNAEIDIGSAAKALQNKGKLNTDSILLVVGNHVALTSNVNSGYEVIKSAVELVNNFAKNGKDFNMEEAAKSMEKLVDISIKGINAEKSNDGDLKVVSIGPFYNNNYIDLKLDEKNVSLKVSMTEGSDGVDTTKIKAEGAADVPAVCDAVIKLMEMTETYKKNLSKIDAVNKAFVDAVQAAISLTDKLSDTTEENSKVKEYIGKARTFVTDLNSVNSRYTVMIPSMNVRVGKAVLAIAAAELKNLEEEKKK